MGVIDALNEGFRIVVRKPLLLAIPIMLDLGLLVSPKPSASELLSSIDTVNSLDAEIFGTLVSAILLLLIALHVPSIGAGGTPAFGSLGGIGIMELGGVGQLLGAALIMLLIGGVISTIYLVLLRRTILPNSGPHQLLPLIVDRAPNLLGLAAIAIAALVTLVALFLLAVNFLSFMAILIGIAVAAGLIAIPFFMFFANVSIIVDDSTPKVALQKSLAFVADDAWPVAGLILLTVLVQLMSGMVLTQIAGTISGYMIAVAANAFIGTVLAAGSMVFYLSRAPGPAGPESTPENIQK